METAIGILVALAIMVGALGLGWLMARRTGHDE
jgi:hypothetical protein